MLQAATGVSRSRQSAVLAVSKLLANMGLAQVKLTMNVPTFSDMAL